MKDAKNSDLVVVKPIDDEPRVNRPKANFSIRQVATKMAESGELPKREEFGINLKIKLNSRVKIFFRKVIPNLKQVKRCLGL